MAKKQQIILLHGTTPLTVNQADGKALLTNGEVAIYNADEAKDAAIYGTTASGELVTFASKAYTDAKVAEITDQIGGGTGISSRLAAVEEKAAANEASIETLEAKDTELAGAIQANAKAVGDEETRAKGAEAALQGSINGLDGELEALTNKVQTIEDDYLKATDKTELQGNIDAEAGAREAADNALGARVQAIEDDYLKAEHKSALESRISANETNIAANATEIAKKADKTTVEKITGRVTTIEGDYLKAEDKTELQGNIDKKADSSTVDAIDTRLKAAEGTISSHTTEIAKKANTTYVDTEVAKAKTEVKLDKASTGIALTPTVAEDGHTVYTLKGENLVSSGELSALDDKVAILIGEDENKSVRTIANEELAAQLLGENNAEDNFKTLQELAAWLEQHPEDAAAMNKSIQANATAISDEAKRAKGAEAALQTAIDSKVGNDTYTAKVNELQTAINGKVAQSVYDAKMTALDTKDGELEAEDTRLAGLISANETSIANNAEAISNEVTRATTAEAALQTAINGKVAQSVYDAKVSELEGAIGDKADSSTVDAIDTRLKAAEGTISTHTTTIAEHTTAIAGKAEKTYVDAELAKKANLDYVNTGLGKKADSSTVTAINGRLETVEANYVKTVKVTSNGVDHTYVVDAKNVLDLSELVIDGGTY